MGWRDRMGPASFRGVPFFVETAEREGGRRTVLHEYPLRDKPFAEDMGRRARSFQVDGHVVGEDYLASRDALIAALEESGPGELVHPYYGTLRVSCTKFRVRESSVDGGTARFGIDFDETEVTPSYPSATPSTAARASASADLAVEAIRAQIAAAKPVSLPTSALASMSGVISAAAQALGAALAPIVTDTQELATFRHAIDNLVLDADALVAQPSNVLDGFLGALTSLTTPVAPPFIMGLLAAYGFTPTSARPPGTTATRLAEQALFDLLLGIVRTVEVVQAARLAPGAAYNSYDAAAAVRDAIVEKIDEQAEATDDGTYATLVQLRADLVRAVPGEETDLPRLVRVTPAYTLPSLVLAHNLYGNLDREADLLARNQVANPGFVTGGRELEVLSAP